MATFRRTSSGCSRPTATSHSEGAMSGQVYTLASREITGALTAEAQDAILDLDGMTAVTLEARFGYGSGGTSASVTFQTSFDGSTWGDVARFDFTTASATKVANLSGLLSKGVTAYAALGSEGVLDGILGDR